MKRYPGMRKLYYQLGGKSDLAEQKAAQLREGYSAILPEVEINGWPAFILHCDELWDVCRRIVALCRELDRLDLDLPFEAKRQFFRQAVIEEIQQTNETENVHSTRKEISDAMDAIRLGKRGARFEGMIRKYELLLTKPETVLESCADVRRLYDEFILEEVLREDPGNAPDGLYFRKGSVSVRNRHDIAIHEGLYPETTINAAMERSLAFLNNADYDPLIRVAAFHFLFAYIHPFYDGNGRMSRFISSAKLLESDVYQLVALRLSYVIKNRRNAYYALFKDANDRHNYGDLTRFVIGFLDFVLEACVQVSEFLRDRQDSIDHYFRQLKRLSLSGEASAALEILIQISVCEGGSLNLTDLERSSGVSKYQLRQHMKEIEPLCLTETKGRARLYRADLDAIDRLAEASGGV